MATLVMQLVLFSAALARLNTNCSALVPQPYDNSPIRSPQAVHSALLPHLRDKDVVEIGMGHRLLAPAARILECERPVLLP